MLKILDGVKRRKTIKYFAILLLGLSIFFSLKRDFFILDEIKIESLFAEEKKDGLTIENVFSSLTDKNGLPSSKKVIVGGVSRDSPKEVLLNFYEPISFDALSIFFDGDLHLATSRAAKSFVIYYRDSNRDWNEAVRIDKNKKSLFKWISPFSIKTTGLKIVFLEPFFYENGSTGFIWFKDVRFFRKKTVNFFTFAQNFLKEHSRGIVAYWFYYLVFISFLFVPGFVLINLLEKNTQRFVVDKSIKFIVSPILMVILMIFTSAIYILLGLRLFLFLPWLIYFLSFIIFLKQKYYLDFFANYNVIFVIFIALLIIFLVLAQRDFLFNLNYVSLYTDYLKPVPSNFYIYHADNLMPWKISRILLNRLPLNSAGAKELLGGTNFFDRTLGLPMITTVILNVFGEGHFVYQRWMEVLAAIYAGALFVFLNSYFSKAIATTGMVLSFLNIPFFWMAFSSEYFSKYFSVYFVFLAFIFYFGSQNLVRLVGQVNGKKQSSPTLDRNIESICLPTRQAYSAVIYFIQNKAKIHFFLAILFLFLGFWFHPSSLIYAIVFGVIILSKEGRKLKSIKKCCLLFLIIFASISFWYFLPFIVGNTNVSNRSYSIFFHDFSSFNENIIKTKLINLTGLFVPNILLKNPDGDGYISLNSKIFKYEFLRYSLISNLTPLFFILAIYFLFKNLKKDRSIVILGFGPFMVYWLLYLNQFNYYFHYGGGYFHLFIFTVPILLTYVSKKIISFKTLISKILLFASYCIFMFYNLYFFSGVFPTIKFVNSIVLIFFRMIVGLYLVICFFLLINIENWKVNLRKNIKK